MPVSMADVTAAIRLLLDREPSGRLEVESIAATCDDAAALRRHLLASDEFERRHPDVAAAEGPAPVIVELEPGVRVVVDLADHAVGVPIARRAFERNELEFVRRAVGAGQHVVDGGAHAGLYSLSMARLVGPAGSVTAFEPVEAHAAWLEQGIRESRASAVRVVRAALAEGNAAGEIVRAARTFNPGSARLRGAGEPVPPGYVLEPVRTVALDDVALPAPVSFVRLDVEGAEGLALRGAERLLRHDRPLLLVEVHADLLPRVSRMTTSELFGRLRTLGYSPHALGAGIVGAPLDDAPSAGVHAVVCLP